MQHERRGIHSILGSLRSYPVPVTGNDRAVSVPDLYPVVLTAVVAIDKVIALNV